MNLLNKKIRTTSLPKMKALKRTYLEKQKKNCFTMSKVTLSDTNHERTQIRKTKK